MIIDVIKKANDKGISIDYESLINLMGKEYGSARRTAMDYINSALTQTNSIIVSCNNNKEIISKSLSYDQVKKGDLWINKDG